MFIFMRFFEASIRKKEFLIQKSLQVIGKLSNANLKINFLTATSILYEIQTSLCIFSLPEFGNFSFTIGSSYGQRR